VRRILTNGSIYIDMAQLTDGQKLLLSLPDERIEGGAAPQAGLEIALRNTFAPQNEVADDEVAAMAALIVRDGGNTLLPRTIRYVEERHQHEGRWTGAIEKHPAPLDVIWGDVDPIAVWPMVERLVRARPDAVVHRLVGVGHYPMVEAPDRFVEALVSSLLR
jgi:pimeloyl-ACP methyl ester carboxylesterase